MRPLLLAVAVATLALAGCSASRSSESQTQESQMQGATTGEERETAPAASPDTCFATRTIDRFQAHRSELDSAATYYTVPQRRMDSLRTRPEATRPEALLRSLQEAGVAVERGYFRGDAASCSPPGSNAGMSVAVPARLVVEVDPGASPASALRSLERVATPQFSPCPYDILELTPAPCSR